MGVWQSLGVAIEMLRRNKLRSFLTMVGVIIGVMAVSIIVMVSSGFTNYMTYEFKKLGSDTIFVFFDPGRRSSGTSLGNIKGLTIEDVEYLLERVQALDIASPVMQIPTQKVTNGDREFTNPRIFATDQVFPELNRVGVQEGRHVNEADVRSRANVAAIGEEVRDKLFPDKQAIGRYISFRGITLEVVGVLERIDIMGETNARDVLVPITTAQDKWIGGDTIMFITTRPKPGVTVNEAMDRIWEAMMLRSGDRPVYRVDSRESIMQVFGLILNFAQLILAAIAALSLLVGGIGIMNIMLVSVTERTKEIGLRKAVGAKTSAVLTQFLVESAVLGLVGGLVGMGMAYGLGLLLTLATSALSWPSKGGLVMSFPIEAAIGAALFSALIGVVFGLYPAIRAARLSPIDALRTE